MRVATRFTRSAAAFRRSETGSLSVIVTLVFISLLGLMGCVMDYALSTSAHATIQRAADRAAEFAVKRFADGPGAVKDTFRKAFVALAGAEYGNIEMEIITKEDPDTVLAKTKMTYHTKMLKMVGFPTIGISTQSKAVAPKLAKITDAEVPPKAVQRKVEKIAEKLPPEIRDRFDLQGLSESELQQLQDIQRQLEQLMGR